MLMLRFKIGVLLLLACTSVGSSQGVASKLATDFYGDPLPAGAIARMGTTRLRHPKAILDYALSPDGKRVISFGAEGSLVEWDAVSGKELRRHDLPHGPFTAAALSADQKQLATIGDENREFVTPQVSERTNRTVRLWDLASGKEIRKITDDARTIGGIAIARDGKTLATLSQGHVVHVWEVPGGKLLHRLDGKESLRFPRPLGFTSDGETLVSGGENGKIQLWDVRTGKKVHEIQFPDGGKAAIVRPIITLAFSPVGNNFAAPGFDKEVLVWNATTGQQIRRLDSGDFAFSNLAFSNDGKCLVFPDKDGVLGKWDIATGTERQRFRQGARPRFSANDAVLAMLQGTSIVFWDVVQGKGRPATFGHENDIFSVSLSPDSKTLATAGIDGFRLWDVATSKPLGGPFSPRHRLVAFAPDGKTIASAGLNGFLHLSEAGTGNKIKQFIPHKIPSANALAFRPDGTIVTAGVSPEICITDPATGVVSLFAEEQRVTAMAVSPNGERMVTNWRGGPICLWDLNTRKMILQIQKPFPNRRALAYSPDGTWFASADDTDGNSIRTTPEYSIYLHVAATGTQVREFGKGLGPYRAVAFSPDGRTLAASGYDRKIRLWELVSGQERHSFSGQGNEAHALTFHPNGSLISANSDGTALVWRAAPQAPPRDLTSAELDALWADLAKDAAKAYDAWGTLAAAPKQVTQFLAKKLQPEKALSTDRLAPLITGLGSAQLAERDKAAKELEGLGDLAGSALRKAVTENLPLEHTRRIRQLLEKLPAPITTEQLRNLRAVEVLEYIGSAEAQQILMALAKGAPGVRLTQESQAALDRLTKNAKAS
jgi:WD40 repeat protein